MSNSTLAALFGLLLALLVAPLQAQPNLRYRALLIGVSEYPWLPKERQLSGPRNDVVRLREVLASRGVPLQDITVLADGVPEAELPTRDRILARLGDLARGARSGDYIVISFGGHGSQQPVPAGSPFAADEPDGLFETFLPRDVEGWTGGTDGRVNNAILDHEIRALVDRMTAAGAFVWAIFDSCHSATMVRSAAGDSEVRLRQVSLQELGVPPIAVEQAARRARSAATAKAVAAPGVSGGKVGQAVYFYAAQTREATPELPLPLDQPQRQTHGLFSHMIAQTLEGGAGMTYSQLAQQVLARYGAVLEARSSPIFAGTALQSPVLGQRGPAVRQWRLAPRKDLSLAAGALAEITRGSIFALLPSATSPNERAMGYARVERVDLSSATLQPIAHAGLPAETVSKLASAAVARLVEQAPDLKVSISVDLSRCDKPCVFEPAIGHLKSKADEPGALALGVAWLDSGRAAHLALTAVGSRLWLMPPAFNTASLCTQVRTEERSRCERELELSLASIIAGPGATTKGLADEVATAVTRAIKVERLLRVSASAGVGELSRSLETKIRVVRSDAKAVPITGSQVQCRQQRTSGRRQSSGMQACLRDGDLVEVEVVNNGSQSIDVTVLYVDSHFGIKPMFPQDGAVNRLEPGAVTRPRLTIRDNTLGLERLIVLGVEVPSRHSERTDLSFLEQSAPPAVTVTRGDASIASAMQLFRDAGFAEHRSRGGEPTPLTAKVGAQVFSWQVTH